MLDDQDDTAPVHAAPQPHVTSLLRGPLRAGVFDNRRTGRPGVPAALLSARFWREWIEHQPYLHQLAQRWMSNNRADAEDVLSRASIKAHDRYLRDCDRIRKLRPWLARLLHNICMDEHRKRSVRHRMPDQFHPEQLEYLSILSRAEPSYEDLNERSESVATAMDAIMDMPERLRHPFVLRFIYQYSNQEIARHLNLTEVNVRKRIQLGRNMVKDRFSRKS